MPRRVLDTNILISHSARVAKGKRAEQITDAIARRWGRELSKTFDSDAIVTPVEVEYLCGQRSGDELRLARAYLSTFNVVDGGSRAAAGLGGGQAHRPTRSARWTTKAVG